MKGEDDKVKKNMFKTQVFHHENQSNFISQLDGKSDTQKYIDYRRENTKRCYMLDFSL